MGNNRFRTQGALYSSAPMLDAALVRLRKGHPACVVASRLDRRPEAGHFQGRLPSLGPSEARAR
jgi:hypothetical protein